MCGSASPAAIVDRNAAMGRTPRRHSPLWTLLVCVMSFSTATNVEATNVPEWMRRQEAIVANLSKDESALEYVHETYASLCCRRVRDYFLNVIPAELGKQPGISASIIDISEYNSLARIRGFNEIPRSFHFAYLLYTHRGIHQSLKFQPDRHEARWDAVRRAVDDAFGPKVFNIPLSGDGAKPSVWSPRFYYQIKSLHDLTSNAYDEIQKLALYVDLRKRSAHISKQYDPWSLANATPDFAVLGYKGNAAEADSTAVLVHRRRGSWVQIASVVMVRMVYYQQFPVKYTLKKDMSVYHSCYEELGSKLDRVGFIHDDWRDCCVAPELRDTYARLTFEDYMWEFYNVYTSLVHPYQQSVLLMLCGALRLAMRDAAASGEADGAKGFSPYASHPHVAPYLRMVQRMLTPTPVSNSLVKGALAGAAVNRVEYTLGTWLAYVKSVRLLQDEIAAVNLEDYMQSISPEPFVASSMKHFIVGLTVVSTVTFLCAVFMAILRCRRRRKALAAQRRNTLMFYSDSVGAYDDTDPDSSSSPSSVANSVGAGNLHVQQQAAAIDLHKPLVQQLRPPDARTYAVDWNRSLPDDPGAHVVLVLDGEQQDGQVRPLDDKLKRGRSVRPDGVEPVEADGLRALHALLLAQHRDLDEGATGVVLLNHNFRGARDDLVRVLLDLSHLQPVGSHADVPRALPLRRLLLTRRPKLLRDLVQVQWRALLLDGAQRVFQRVREVRLLLPLVRRRELRGGEDVNLEGHRPAAEVVQALVRRARVGPDLRRLEHVAEALVELAVVDQHRAVVGLVVHRDELDARRPGVERAEVGAREPRARREEPDHGHVREPLQELLLRRHLCELVLLHAVHVVLLGALHVLRRQLAQPVAVEGDHRHPLLLGPGVLHRALGLDLPLDDELGEQAPQRQRRHVVRRLRGVRHKQLVAQNLPEQLLRLDLALIAAGHLHGEYDRQLRGLEGGLLAGHQRLPQRHGPRQLAAFPGVEQRRFVVRAPLAVELDAPAPSEERFGQGARRRRASHLVPGEVRVVRARDPEGLQRVLEHVFDLLGAVRHDHGVELLRERPVEPHDGEDPRGNSGLGQLSEQGPDARLFLRFFGHRYRYLGGTGGDFQQVVCSLLPVGSLHLFKELLVLRVVNRL
ncbi:uncharacterized protein BcabD6B2_20580 [Babesia caballi]|uniref:Uncharacterized protein n=1 Tax=Babesia caballi TaxID=5871 RepID=A0AAV4LR11_BABCB|nr:hypothetical protein, conserved [Babesia caballi]